MPAKSRLYIKKEQLLFKKPLFDILKNYAFFAAAFGAPL